MASELSAANWIERNRLNVPYFKHPVPKQGDYIRIIRVGYFSHDRTRRKLGSEIVYVKQVTDFLVVCTTMKKGNPIESYQISEFKNGYLLFDTVEESVSQENVDSYEAMII